MKRGHHSAWKIDYDVVEFGEERCVIFKRFPVTVRENRNKETRKIEFKDFCAEFSGRIGTFERKSLAELPMLQNKVAFNKGWQQKKERKEFEKKC